jgi:uncharacterized phage-like protein YoqJ
MTIDERLDRLTERHEALTQTVELMAHQQQEWEKKNQEWQEKNQVPMAHILESLDTLARIAHVHERRISNLEGGQP